jgi:predicted MFS family arabinose efflux permease
MFLIIALLCFVAQIVLWMMLPASAPSAPEPAPAEMLHGEPVPVPVAGSTGS